MQIAHSSDAFPGRIYKLSLDGKVLGMLGKTGKQPGQFGWIHEIACPSEDELYVAELLNWRVQKTSPKWALVAVSGYSRRLCDRNQGSGSYRSRFSVLVCRPCTRAPRIGVKTIGLPRLPVWLDNRLSLLGRMVWLSPWCLRLRSQTHGLRSIELKTRASL